MILKEACVGSYKEALSAVSKGAHRLELCDNLLEGGTTPSYGTIALAQEKLQTPLLVMIRPRGGDFVYTADEVEIMLHDIKTCKDLGVYGVVFGALTEDNTLDMATMKILVDASKPMKITCHMAFDELEDPIAGLDGLIELGVDRVLTKGCKTNAPDGIETLKQLVEHAADRITIVAGGGISADNYQKIADATGVSEVHGTKIVGVL
jgi:copper homeostasis protein